MSPSDDQAKRIMAAENYLHVFIIITGYIFDNKHLHCRVHSITGVCAMNLLKLPVRTVKIGLMTTNFGPCHDQSSAKCQAGQIEIHHMSNRLRHNELQL